MRWTSYSFNTWQNDIIYNYIYWMYPLIYHYDCHIHLCPQFFFNFISQHPLYCCHVEALWLHRTDSCYSLIRNVTSSSFKKKWYLFFIKMLVDEIIPQTVIQCNVSTVIVDLLDQRECHPWKKKGKYPALLKTYITVEYWKQEFVSWFSST